MRHLRFAHIVPIVYPAAVIDHYRRWPELAAQPYDVQLSALLSQKYTYSDGFTRGMRGLGHEAFEVVYDVAPLRRAWRMERGLTVDGDGDVVETVLAQLRELKPDVVFFQDSYGLPAPIRRDLKSLLPGVRLVAIFRGYPGGTPEQLRVTFAGADVLFLGSPVLLQKCALIGLPVHLVYHAFDEDVLARLQSVYGSPGASYDFTFLGSSGYGYGRGHRSRYEMLSALFQRSTLIAWLDESPDLEAPGAYRRLRRQIRRLLKPNVERLGTRSLDGMAGARWLPSSLRALAQEVGEDRRRGRVPDRRLGERFPDRCRPPLFGLDMYRVLEQSSLTFNIHSDVACGTVDNMRMFQATGMGTCLLTDHGTNLSDLFEPDREVVAYDSVNECVEKVQYLLVHSGNRREIAAAGQRRCLADHSVSRRCQQMDMILQTLL